MSWLFVFLLIAKTLGALKEVIVAWRFGAGEIANAYVFAMAIVLWLPMLLQSVLTSVVVPVMMRAELGERGSKELFTREFSAFTALVGLFWTGGLLATARLGVFPDELGDFGRSMLEQLALVGALAAIGAGFAVRLLAKERYGMHLIESVPALVLIPFVALPASGVDTLVLGTVTGYCVFLGVAIFYARKHRAFALPRLGFRSEYWLPIRKGLGVMIISQVVMSLTNVIDPWMTAELAGGDVAALGYANRVVSLLVTFGGSMVASAIFPVLSDISAREGHGLVFKHAMLWARWSFLAGLGVAFVGWFSAPYAIAFLFERGAFRSDDTLLVSTIFQCGLLQVPAYMAGIILVQALASTGHYRWIAIGAILNVLVKLAANTVLASHYGAAGIALGTTIMYAISLIFLLIMSRRAFRS
ncbi:lipid II flippase MurJ [Sphingosinicella microcystinivorans]|nr:lipid II flippase MurJ [Sphingosinicella microcystinivorans]RKS90879.1 peptidoglycan biosynthesis protein MviN/MurJ (putative lipid II flippase) [Sphingosinicella microcystinivorans]